MLKISLYTSFLFLLVTLTAVKSEDKKLTPEELQQKQMESMQLAQPGPEHERLARLAGDWEQEVKFWMSAGAEPMTFTGSSTGEMILGGRFLQTKGIMKSAMGDSESLNIMGFDRRTKKYTSAGFDTWGTYFVTAQGDFDEEDGTIVLHGEDYDPVFEINQTFNIVLKFEGDDKYTVRLYFTGMEEMFGADPFLMVETVSTRKK